MAAGVYIHIPFCKSRCSYCDFATDVYRSSEAVERYVNALSSEIEGSTARVSEWLTGESSPPADAGGIALIDTIYFGGGTPSLLSPLQAEKILTSVTTVFSVPKDAEITMEMNPATVTAETLRGYRQLGVNRASFGVQTFNDRDLKLLARGHDANDARTTYKLLRDANFDNISFDLIAGLPGQTMDDWRRNLGEAVAMSPEHLSLYLLEIHESTPLAEQLRTQRRPLPAEDRAAEMYELMIDTLTAAGYAQYEISNFAKPGFESRHNNKYWTLDPVFGFGVSAHSFDGTKRYSNERDTNKYVSMIEAEGSAEVYREVIDRESERIFLGLRLNAGVDADGLEDRAKDLIANGLLINDNDKLKLTRKGMLFSNEVFAEFV